MYLGTFPYDLCLLFDDDDDDVTPICAYVSGLGDGAFFPNAMFCRVESAGIRKAVYELFRGAE
jgi:hypothetical protein